MLMTRSAGSENGLDATEPMQAKPSQFLQTTWITFASLSAILQLTKTQ